MNTVSLRDKNLFYIGGVVRDKLLGKDSFDIDLTYSGNAVEFVKNLPDAQILQINEPFGTVKIKFEGEEIDIAQQEVKLTRKKVISPLSKISVVR